MRFAFHRPLLRMLPIAALLALAAAPARAQAGASDAGTYIVSVGGRQVGTEQFTIVQTGVGANAEIVASGHLQLQLPTGIVDLIPRLRTTGLQANPVSYEVTVGGARPSRTVSNISGGRVTSRILTGAGEQLREYLVGPDAVVLDDGIAHQYYFLARRMRNGTVPVILPRENRQVVATVTGRGEESVLVGSQPVSLYHIVVAPAGADERHVWVDALGRVIKLEIPARDYVAVRSEIPA